MFIAKLNNFSIQKFSSEIFCSCSCCSCQWKQSLSTIKWDAACTQCNNVIDFSDIMIIMMSCHYCLTVSPTNEDVHVSDAPRAGLSWRPCSSRYLIYNSKTQYSAPPASHHQHLYSIQGDAKNCSLRRSRVDQQLCRSHFVPLWKLAPSRYLCTIDTLLDLCRYIILIMFM